MELAIEIVGFFLAVAFVAGAIDAIVGGGGLLSLPALVAVGASLAAALGMNKVQSTFGVATAAVTFARKGRIDFRRFLGPALAAFFGAAGGASPDHPCLGLAGIECLRAITCLKHQEVLWVA